MNRTDKKAFTLIETIAVITAIACVAAALFVPLIRRLDEAVRQKESTALATIASTYKERVTTTRTVPDHTGWAAAVAAATGWQANVVANTARGLPRIFLIDPNLRIGTNGPAATNYALPYSQAVKGHTFTNNLGVVRPINPRLMVISSVGAALPSSLVSGVGAASGIYAFNNLWGTTNGTIPSGWSSWTGRADDLKIQRIDLSDLFVRVALNNRDATTALPSYGISTSINSFVTDSVGFGCRTNMYFLKGSEIRLYNVAGTMEHSEILSKSQSYTFERGTWEPEAYTAPSVGQTSALDLQRVMNLFMAAPPNTNAQAGVTQTTVSNNMVAFLNAYIAWRDGPPSVYKSYPGGKASPEVIEAQSDLESALSDLINSP